jgi:hypothetical protein
VDHLVNVGGSFGGDDLKDGAGNSADGEGAEDVAAGDGLIRHFGPRKKKEGDLTQRTQRRERTEEQRKEQREKRTQSSQRRKKRKEQREKMAA